MGAVLTVPEEIRIDHLRRWAPTVVLAPLVPCMYALLVIFSGEIVTHLYSTDCVKALGAFVKGAVGLSYALLLTFMWSFMGFSVNIPLRNDKVIEVASPFVRVRTLARVYLAILICAFAWWGLGSYLITGASPCRQTSPVLWAYTLLLLGSFWLLFIGGMVYLSRKEGQDRQLRFALTRKDDGEEAAAEEADPSKLEADEKVLKSKFDEYDGDGSGQIEAAELGALLSSMGIELSEQELTATMSLLDEGGDGNISFKELLKWYRMSPAERRRWMKKMKGKVPGASRMRGEGEDEGKAGGEDDDDDDDDDEDDKK